MVVSMPELMRKATLAVAELWLSGADKNKKLSAVPATRSRSSGPLGALLSSPALDVRLMIALQVLQDRALSAVHINAQLRTQDAQAQTVEKGERDSNDSQKSANSPLHC